ncbi:uncharacterized protein PFL1_03954 [Pseudozyma flocculosa PF-1]|uniref:Rhodanese domain-containing protein n=1 Tax=Pseudozyma flocculosa PF-1 TaxID=1277687 RepID=A0A061HDF2_9BASI|nr:uncharacterized protein PFL1_03954 [Pseudozyma flocculosa PF-1]EPQ28651.1 hypothetical protein PFL1_03954 [Pseudozyma flocculosa PF-1]
MADPLAAVQGSVPTIRAQPTGNDAEGVGIRQLWSDIFRSFTASDQESLRAKALGGEVPVGDRPTMRWIHWKLFLSEHLSSTPTSWTAVLDKDRSHYAELRRDMLRAPDGNYPPDLGLEDDEQVLAQMSRSHGDSTSSRPSLSSSRSSSGRGYASGGSVLGDLSVNNPLSLDDSNPWKTHYASLETRQTIAQDVERTFPDLALFRESRVQKGLANALFVWCGQNQDVGYRQGMHELLAVLWLVRQRDSTRQGSRAGSGGRGAQGPLGSSGGSARLDEDVMQAVLGERWIEHDVYTLFCALMQRAKSWFEWRTPQPAEPAQPRSAVPRTMSWGSLTGLPQPSTAAANPTTPIVAKCERIRQLLHTTDPSLAQHLDALAIEPQLFALRWIRLIFTREFPLEDALKLWDGIFAMDRSLALIDHVCVAMLMRVRNELLTADYSGALQALLRYPVNPDAPDGGNRTELLVQQAIYLRDNGSTPASGVAIVLQNRDLLGIPPRFPDAERSLANERPSNGSLGSPTSTRDAPYAAIYQARGPSKFATVGRSPSGANPVSSWQRPTPASRLPATAPPSRHPARRFDDPLSASAAMPQSPSRSFGIVPSAYIPEGISDFARGLYERSDSLGINRALNSTMANVQRTVTAAAAGVAASNAASSAAGNGGFPSSFSDSLTPSVSHASLSATSTTTPAGFQPAVPRRNASAAAGRTSGPGTNSASSPSISTAELTAKLEGLTTTNKALGAALATCIETLETSWLSRQEVAPDGISARPAGHEDLDQSDVDTLMSFTALKHIRDVLNGSAREFDSATLPSKRPAADPADQKNAAQALPAASKAAAAPQPLPPGSNTNGAASATTSSDHGESIGAAPNNPHVETAAALAGRTTPTPPPGLPMCLAEYQRYGRQMILPDFGLEGQLRLRRSKVLVVGAGGLGCPAVQYLAAAGVGQISIVDHDSVEASNLARQILHSDAKIGINKAESAAQAAHVINPFINVTPHPVGISSANARSLISGHDLVLDCTDNPLTRYLISDAAVLEGVEVVSGAAQGYDGQLIVLHKKILPQFASKPTTAASPASTAPALVDPIDNARGPCYRCLFPVAPKPEDVTDCEDGGVLGGITGLVGTMQALESVKILAQIGEATLPTMTLVSPMSGTPFRSIRLRPRRLATCRTCGDPAQVGRDNMISDLQSEDYATFCHLNRPPMVDGQAGGPRVAVEELEKGAAKRLLIDVRPPVEFGITRIDGSISLPYTTIRKDPSKALETIRSRLSTSPVGQPPLLVCRKGNDSQLAVRLLQQAARDAAAATEVARQEAVQDDPLSSPSTDSAAPSRARRDEELEFTDLVGGLRAYAKVKDGFPMY